VQLRRRHHPLHAVIASAFLLNACGGGGGSDSSSTPAPQKPAVSSRPIAQTDLEIATAIYNGTARVPAGFYSEAAPVGHGTVATKHVKNTDVDTALAPSASEFELCTDDWNQALAWSETFALNSPQYSNLVATNDDGRYFEFARVQSGSPDLYVQSRIYKCAYLNRSAANLRAATGAAGQLNARPLTSDELRRLSEYFWQFTSYNNFGHMVLKSAGSTSPMLEHTLHMASLVRGGLSASCDRIDVIAWTHRVDTATGALTLDVQTLFSFGAKETAGVAQLCAN